MKTYYVTDNVDIIPFIDGKVTSIFFDIESYGKRERQASNHIISNSGVDEIGIARSLTKDSEFMVRVNPVHDGTRKEVKEAKINGADLVMLPFFRGVEEVEYFFSLCGENLPICLLVETPEALINLRKILWKVPVKRVHFGLNDLSISLRRENIFEVVFDNSLYNAIEACNEFSVPFGIGGIGKVGLSNPSPKEFLYRCKAKGAEWIILNRSFADYRKNNNVKVFSDDFNFELLKINKLFSTLDSQENLAIKTVSEDLGFKYTKLWYEEKK